MLTAIVAAVAAAVAASVPPAGYDPLARWVTWGEVPAVYDASALSQVPLFFSALPTRRPAANRLAIATLSSRCDNRSSTI